MEARRAVLASMEASGTSTPDTAGSESSRPTKICVYCGSSTGTNPAHLEAARALARAMAANNISLVYGGGTVGLMGEVAKTLVSLSGPDAVHGIIPEALVKYERDPTYTSTHANGDASLAVPEEKMFGKTTVVKDMHTRKQRMVKEVVEAGPGSGFIALSGGYGTIEELMETATWNQLGIHNRGICVLNINGFYDGILEWIRTSIKQGFIHEGNADIIVEATDAESAVKALSSYKVSRSVLNLAWGNS